MVVEASGVPLTVASQTIYDTYINLTFTEGILSIPDGGNIEITLKTYLETSNIDENKLLQFYIDADDHGWTFFDTGTKLQPNFGTDVFSEIHGLEVIGTELTILDQPDKVDLSTDFSVSTKATDANGNTTSYEYDLLNRLIAETDAIGKRFLYC